MGMAEITGPTAFPYVLVAVTASYLVSILLCFLGVAARVSRMLLWGIALIVLSPVANLIFWFGICRSRVAGNA